MDENEKWSQRKYMELKGLTEDFSLKVTAPIGRMEIRTPLLHKLLIVMLKEFKPPFLTQLFSSRYIYKKPMS